MLEEEEIYDGESLFEQEFSEQDVLPFLLQAQDIISKLESRVVELESDLSVSLFFLFIYFISVTYIV